MVVYDSNGEQPLSAMISMITKVSFIQNCSPQKFVLHFKHSPEGMRFSGFCRILQELLRVWMRLVMALRVVITSPSQRFRAW